MYTYITYTFTSKFPQKQQCQYFAMVSKDFQFDSKASLARMLLNSLKKPNTFLQLFVRAGADTLPHARDLVPHPLLPLLLHHRQEVLYRH